MSLDPETPVIVRRHWNDFRQGTVLLKDLGGFHRASESGSVGRASPRPMLSAYMLCTALQAGEIAHSCMHGPPPHRIKVVIVQRDNDRAVVREIKRLVAEGEQRHAPQA